MGGGCSSRCRESPLIARPIFGFMPTAAYARFIEVRGNGALLGA